MKTISGQNLSLQTLSDISVVIWYNDWRQVRIDTFIAQLVGVKRQKLFVRRRPEGMGLSRRAPRTSLGSIGLLA